MSRSVRLLAFITALVVCTPACRSHVQLTATPPTASERERIEAYERLRPVRSTMVIDISTGTTGHGTSGIATPRTTGVVLQSGDYVQFPEDLAGVLDPDSASARAALRAATWRTWKRASFLALAASFAVTVASGARDVRRSPYDPTFSPLTYAAAVASLIAGTTGGLSYLAERNNTNVAFATYDGALRDYLRLCVRDLRVVDCGEAPYESEVPAP